MRDTSFFVPEITEKQGMKKIVILPIADNAGEGYNNNVGTVSCGGTSLRLRDSV